MHNIVSARVVCYFSLGFCEIVSFMLHFYLSGLSFKTHYFLEHLEIKTHSSQASRSLLRYLQAGLAFNDALLR